MNYLDLPKRVGRERSYGLTSVSDFGIPVQELRHILEDYHYFIDVAKLGVGTAYVTPNIEEKVNLYKSYGVKVYFGGTLFEKCYLQKRLKEYINYLKRVGVEWIEISNGTLDISLSERVRLVNELKGDFSLLGEVGSKDQAKDLSLQNWVEEMSTLLDAGCQYVITEGRDSGTAGIYNPKGEVKQSVVTELSNALDINKIIFEAPTHKQQMYFINTFGANVNLGNVRPHDVLLLEAERVGLRSETFFINKKNNEPNYVNETYA